MFKKVIFFSLIIFFALGLSGCRNDNSAILFNSQPITKDNFLNNSREFKVGERIYYLFMTKKPLKCEIIRVQVIKKDEKTSIGGYKIQYANDYRLYEDEVYYYNNYVVLYERGYYVMQIFSKDFLDKPLAIDSFYVK